ncbi:transmembrane domain-containing protein TMIGD3-like [Leopardus geoffroyi]|uniref:transmembrane domain-containing protein TMIGD3-like n=1 Tax=Leopardus geoffroyi TaxID=46844 RepID=UPI001E264B0F|nr:transmembrane domain-containing protein TMIGD3-like [Leopardus geoffroyi]
MVCVCVCVCVCVHVCHALRDTGSKLIITLSCLTKEDIGWYPCGIQWDFARDDLDFTELVVTDDRGGLASDFWSGKDLSGDRNRSCRASNVAHKANPPGDLSVIPSGMSILIICILITGLGIISIISHLSERRRSQRNRRGKGPARSQRTSQAPSVIPTPLPVETWQLESRALLALMFLGFEGVRLHYITEARWEVNAGPMCQASLLTDQWALK